MKGREIIVVKTKSNQTMRPSADFSYNKNKFRHFHIAKYAALPSLVARECSSPTLPSRYGGLGLLPPSPVARTAADEDGRQSHEQDIPATVEEGPFMTQHARC